MVIVVIIAYSIESKTGRNLDRESLWEAESLMEDETNPNVR